MRIAIRSMTVGRSLPFRLCVLCAFLCGLCVEKAAPCEPPPARAMSPRVPSSLDGYRYAPLSFVPNAGQMDPRVRYVARAGGAVFWFTSAEVVLALRGQESTALRLRFTGANPTPIIEAGQAGTERVSYFHGSDPRRWQRGLSAYHELVYRELWPGIDMAVRGAEGRLKYEFVVRPGASVEKIGLRYEGADRLQLDAKGQLLVRTAAGTLTDERPTSYQLVDGRRVAVESRYRLGKHGAYGFAVGAYDRSQPIVIDPGLVYSTFLGGNGTDLGMAIAVDGAGGIYLAGDTSSTDFPITPGAFDGTPNSPLDVFVTKLDATGALVYSTFLGGGLSDNALAIAVDGAGNAFVSGWTWSTDFPTTAGAFDRNSHGNIDAFVTKLNATGTALVYSTYLGGRGLEQNFGGIAVDAAGNAYVTGGTSSPDFPTTPGAFQAVSDGGADVFVTKLDPTGASLVYSTLLHGSGPPTIGGSGGIGIAVDGAGAAYVTGLTSSPTFPTTPGAFDRTFDGTVDGNGDAFVVKLDPAGASLLYSTFLGGSGDDWGMAIALDAAGRAYVAGFTFSRNFPTTPGAFAESWSGQSDTFVVKLDASGSSLLYSTYLGGSGVDIGLGISLDSAGSAYVTGFTQSANFPTTSGAFDATLGGTQDGFVTKLDAAGAIVLYSTFLGGGSSDEGRGIVAAAGGKALVVGFTQSADFPTTPGALDTSFGSANDAFFAEIDTGNPSPILALSPNIATNPVGTSHTVTAHVVEADGGLPAEDRLVRFAVSGSVTAEGTCRTDAAGACFFTYAGPAFPGTDAISAFADANENGTQDEGEPAATAAKQWVLPTSTSGRARGFGAIPGNSGRNVRFSFSARSDGGFSGTCAVRERAAGKTIDCTDVTALVVSGNEVTFFGNATENGVATTYVIHAVDNGRPGGGQDTFSIVTAAGYAASETLDFGNVSVRP